MAKKYCSYQDCRNFRNSFGNNTFFIIPNDARRKKWIEHSGNEELKFLTEKSKKFFCQNHFHPAYVRTQFSRTTLSRSAIPFKYSKEGIYNIDKIRKGDILYFDSQESQDDKSMDENISIDLESDENKTDTIDKIDKYVIEYADDYQNIIEEKEDDSVEYCDVSSTDKPKTDPQINRVLNSNVEIDNNFLFELFEENYQEDEDKEIVSENTYSMNYKSYNNENELKRKNTEIYEPKTSKIIRNNFIEMHPLKTEWSDEISSSTSNINEKIASLADIKNHEVEEFLDEEEREHVDQEENININLIERISNSENETTRNTNMIVNTVKREESQVNRCLNDEYEEDKHFALSLVGNFQRLPKKKKSIAKLKILQYLTELEFSESANI